MVRRNRLWTEGTKLCYTDKNGDKKCIDFEDALGRLNRAENDIDGLDEDVDEVQTNLGNIDIEIRDSGSKILDTLTIDFTDNLTVSDDSGVASIVAEGGSSSDSTLTDPEVERANEFSEIVPIRKLGTFTDTNLDNPQGVGRHGNYIYVTNGNSTNFYSIDIETPSSPQLVSTAGSFTSPRWVTVHRGILWIGHENTLESWNISDPANPSQIATNNGFNDSLVWGMIADKNTFYFNTYNTLYRVDISDPTSITISGTYSAEDTYGVELGVSEHYVYIRDEIDYNIHIIDFTDASTPSEAGIIDYGDNYAINSAAFNDRLLVYNGNWEFDIYDISDKANPTLLDTLVPSTSAGGDSWIERGNYFYGADNYGLVIIDTNNLRIWGERDDLGIGTLNQIEVKDGLMMYTDGQADEVVIFG